MCTSCSQFPLGCGSPVCLTGEEVVVDRPKRDDSKIAKNEGVCVKSADTHSISTNKGVMPDG